MVLVHGGGLAADCWALTVDEIGRILPDLTVLAVDLPGRRGKPGDPERDTIADFVDSVVRDIRTAGLEDIVVVGHSMAGLVVPGVAAALGPRVREVVFASAVVPPEGQSVVDTLTGPLAPKARQNAKKGGLSYSPKWGVRFAYLNGVPRARRKFLDDKIYPEFARLLAEKVSRKTMPDDVPRSWILTLRDRANSPKLQLAYIEAVGGVHTVTEMDTCHCMMVSEPERLAQILAERCRLYAT